MRDIQLEDLDGKVIHCSTQEEAIMLFDFLYKIGYMAKEEGYKNRNDKVWMIYKEDTTYRLHHRSTSYSPIFYYNNIGYTITEMSELYTMDLEQYYKELMTIDKY